MSAYEAAVERISLLERLQALRSEGAISEEDFAAQKARVLQPGQAAERFAEDSTPPGADWIPPERAFELNDTRTRAAGLGIVALLFLLTGGYFWLSPAEAVAEEAQVYTVAKTVNVRSAPTTEGSEVVGKFAPGSQFKAVKEAAEWVKIAEGRYAGSYIWSKNLIVEVEPNGAPSADPSSATASKEEALETARTASAEASIGRCHMGLCSWSRELGRETVSTKGTATLYKVRLLGGESHHEGNDYNTKMPIKWNSEPHSIYVFCSTLLPSVFFEEMPVEVDVIDFINGPPGVLTSSANLYWRTCHGAGDWTADARQKGYRVPTVSSFTLRSPTDILRHAPVASGARN